MKIEVECTQSYTYTIRLVQVGTWHTRRRTPSVGVDTKFFFQFQNNWEWGGGLGRYYPMKIGIFFYTLWALITPAMRVVLIKTGVRGGGVIRAILEREYHVFEKLPFLEFGILHP